MFLCNEVTTQPQEEDHDRSSSGKNDNSVAAQKLHGKFQALITSYPDNRHGISGRLQPPIPDSSAQSTMLHSVLRHRMVY